MDMAMLVREAFVMINEYLQAQINRLTITIIINSSGEVLQVVEKSGR